MDLFNEFATNEKLEAEGTWIDYNEDTKFLIARINNPAYNRVFNATWEKNKTKLKNDKDEKLGGDLMADVMAKTILLGWEGPVSLKGEALPYSEENAARVLRLKEFRLWVIKQANNVENFLAVQSQEDAKN